MISERTVSAPGLLHRRRGHPRPTVLNLAPHSACTVRRRAERKSAISAGSEANADRTVSHATSRDGLRLYARLRGARARCAAVRVPRGATRNCCDFHDLATALAERARGRDVYALDSRGRGRSRPDPTGRIYRAGRAQRRARLHDHEGPRPRRRHSGSIAMPTAALRPNALGAVVLNDIGPVIEPTPRRMSSPTSWAACRSPRTGGGGRLVMEMNRRQFTASCSGASSRAPSSTTTTACRRQATTPSSPRRSP